MANVFDAALAPRMGSGVNLESIGGMEMAARTDVLESSSLPSASGSEDCDGSAAIAGDVFLSAPESASSLRLHPLPLERALPRIVERLNGDILRFDMGYLPSLVCGMGAVLSLGLAFLMNIPAIGIITMLLISLTLIQAGLTTDDRRQRLSAGTPSYFLRDDNEIIAASEASKDDRLQGTPLLACQSLQELDDAREKEWQVVLHDVLITDDVICHPHNVNAIFAGEARSNPDAGFKLWFPNLEPHQAAELKKLLRSGERRLSLTGRVLMREGAAFVVVRGFVSSSEIKG